MHVYVYMYVYMFMWCIYVCICGCVDVFIYMCMFACVPIIKKEDIIYQWKSRGDTGRSKRGEDRNERNTVFMYKILKKNKKFKLKAKG